MIISNATTKSPLDGSEYVPLSGTPPKKAAISAIKDYVLSFFSNKSTLDRLGVSSGYLSYNSLDVAIGWRNTAFSNKSSSFSHTTSSNEMIMAIIIAKMTGTPLVKIGTSSSGEEIAEEFAPSTNGNVIIPYLYKTGSQTIYFTIGGGSVEISIVSMKNILAQL